MQEIADRRGLAVAQVLLGGGRPQPQIRHRGLPHRAIADGDREAALGQVDRRGEQGRPVHRAEAIERLHPAAEIARHERREDAAILAARPGLLEDGQFGRRRGAADEIEDHRRGHLLGLDHHVADAARPGHVRLDDIQGRRRGDRRVDRVAPLLQHSQPRHRGVRVRRGDRPPPPHHHRTMRQPVVRPGHPAPPSAPTGPRPAVIGGRPTAISSFA